MNKKNFQLFIFTVILLIFSSNVNARALSFDNTILNKYVTNYKELEIVAVDKNKTFTITFNKDINYRTINNNTVKVINSKGEDVAVTVATKSGNDRVGIVMPPSGGYIEGEIYALIITNKVNSIDNKGLNKEIVKKFTIKSSNTNPQETNKNEDELFIENLYKTNSPYWNQGLKFTDGKLNIQNYDYTGWKTLSTSFNPNINKQVIDTFKALYTEKEGYKTEVIYSIGNNNTGLSNIEFYGKGLTVRGEAFVDIAFFDSVKSTDQGDIFTVAIPECTKENYNNNNYIIKNALGAALNSSYSEQIFNYIDNQYKNTVLAGKNDYIVISKTFGNYKIIVNSYNKSLYADIIKL